MTIFVWNDFRGFSPGLYDLKLFNICIYVRKSALETLCSKSYVINLIRVLKLTFGIMK